MEERGVVSLHHKGFAKQRACMPCHQQSTGVCAVSLLILSYRSSVQIMKVARASKRNLCFAIVSGHVATIITERFGSDGMTATSPAN